MNATTKTLWASFAVVSVLVLLPGRLWAQRCGTCVPCPPVKCRMWTPQMVTEYRTKTITTYRPETRERMVTVFRDVPVTETIQESYMAMAPQTRTRIVTDTINRPVYGDIQLRTTTAMSKVEGRQGKVTLTRLVPVQEQRTMNESGCCTTSPPVAPSPPVAQIDPNAPPPPPGARPEAAEPGGTCNLGCNSCPTRVCVTSWKPVREQETVQYAVTQLQPDSQMSTVAFYEYRPETKQRTERYVVQVPEVRTRPRQVTVMRTVAEQQPERYTVMTPYQEQIRVPVLVCRWVERTVDVR